MARCRSLLCTLGIFALTAFAPVKPSPAASIPVIGSTLSDAQKAALNTAMAVQPELSYGQIIAKALAEGMPCEEVVAYLCGNAGNPSEALENQKKIVYAAIDVGKCNPGDVITRALQAGAPLDSVIQAALRAGVDRQVIANAAFGAGYTPEQIAMVFTNLLEFGGGTGGWSGGWGGPPLLKGPPVTPPASPSLP
jgi:hypothetical protein